MWFISRIASESLYCEYTLYNSNIISNLLNVLSINCDLIYHVNGGAVKQNMASVRLLLWVLLRFLSLNVESSCVLRADAKRRVLGEANTSLSILHVPYTLFLVPIQWKESASSTVACGYTHPDARLQVILWHIELFSTLLRFFLQRFK